MKSFSRILIIMCVIYLADNDQSPNMTSEVNSLVQSNLQKISEEEQKFTDELEKVRDDLSYIENLIEEDILGEKNMDELMRDYLPYVTHSIQNLIDHRPQRVRTVEELKNRSSESVVLDFIGLVQRVGDYTAEEYTVDTDDGYILKLHRVSGSPSSPKADGKPVAYLQHHLFGSSDSFVEYIQNQSLALQLADNGYDVWLGNLRGNAYSRAHSTLSPDKDVAKFWKFSMDEHATLDLPVMMDFILEKTDQQNLTYIGYSLGATLSYMFLSAKPEYNDKINLLVNYAPAVIFSKPIAIRLSLIFDALVKAPEDLDILEVLPQSILLQNTAKEFCKSDSFNLCTAAMGLLADRKNIGYDVLPELIAYVPAGTSYYVVKHYQQLADGNRKLLKFDWCSVGFSCSSSESNDSTLDSTEYDLSLVTVPNALFYGDQDFIAKTSDVDYLKSKLKNTIAYNKVNGFNHGDFAINENVKKLVYDPTVQIMTEDPPIPSIDPCSMMFLRAACNILHTLTNLRI